MTTPTSLGLHGTLPLLFPFARVVIDPGSDRSVNKVNQNRSIVNIIMIDRPVGGEP